MTLCKSSSIYLLSEPKTEVKTGAKIIIEALKVAKIRLVVLLFLVEAFQANLILMVREERLWQAHGPAI